MKKRWTIVIGLVALVAAGSVFLLFPQNSARTRLEATRRALRQEGFKIDPAEFDLSASPEQRTRAAALTNAALTGATLGSADSVGHTVLLRQRWDFLPMVGLNAAVVVWKQEKLPSEPSRVVWRPQSSGQISVEAERVLELSPSSAIAQEAEGEAEEDFWLAVREACTEHCAPLDAACQAAMSGPIRIDLAASHGTSMLLPRLAAIRNLARILCTRMTLELHDGHKDAAWTNLLASTRLVTAWEPEPFEVSHLVRFDCANLAYNITWQALQAEGWADDRLARLQHEWELVDFFRGLPEAVAFTRAAAADVCQHERKEPLGPSFFFRDLTPSPRGVWRALSERWNQLQYRHYGSYEDERDLLLYYRERELQVRRALQTPTWSEMRLLPGVTNLAPFQSKYGSRMQSLLKIGQLSAGFAGRGQNLLSRAAEAEARRRILIAAIALERYRGWHGEYPKSLQDLDSELLRNPLLDFMDGQPLRYRLTPDGHIALYSVGLECIDDGGMLMRRGRRGLAGFSVFTSSLEASQLVWPRPASAAQAQAYDESAAQLARLKQRMQETRKQRQMQEERRARQAVVEGLLGADLAGKTASRSSMPGAPEPKYQGRPLRALLRNAKTAGPNQLTLDELLTLRQITDGAYDGTARFELPVSYDAATNIGFLHLVVDGGMDVASQRGQNGRQTWERAANGNCLLGWTSTYDAPGKHAIQAEFLAAKHEAKSDIDLQVAGPPIAFVSTNLCQFDPAYDHFDARGMTLYARLVEPRGIYAIELKTPTGEHIKTLEGATSNGVIRAHWDLIDDRGNRCTNQSIDSVFHVTLPDSGRSQTLKGP